MKVNQEVDTQLELFDADDDGMDFGEWMLSLPLTPPTQPQPLPDRPTLFPELELRRSAA
jgi:hypothetical protein